jgi:hypothetical protein
MKYMLVSKDATRHTETEECFVSMLHDTPEGCIKQYNEFTRNDTINRCGGYTIEDYVVLAVTAVADVVPPKKPTAIVGKFKPA